MHARLHAGSPGLRRLGTAFAGRHHKKLVVCASIMQLTNCSARRGEPGQAASAALRAGPVVGAPRDDGEGIKRALRGKMCCQSMGHPVRLLCSSCNEASAMPTLRTCMPNCACCHCCPCRLPRCKPPARPRCARRPSWPPSSCRLSLRRWRQRQPRCAPQTRSAAVLLWYLPSDPCHVLAVHCEVFGPPAYLG